MMSHSIFRNYDVRGEYGVDLTDDTAYRIARGYSVGSGARRVVVGRDARTSSGPLRDAVVQGLVDSGAHVTDIGMVATDVVYFATWHGAYDGGIMVTASHMPKQYNGMKFLRLDAKGVLSPIGRGLGMEELEAAANAAAVSDNKTGGMVLQEDIWESYVAFVRSFVDVSAFLPLRVVMDAGNGMGGVVARRVFAGLTNAPTELFFEPDGTFPNHDPNPILPENRTDIIAAVRESGADIGIAWDADCDRCYFIDEKGNFVNGDFITALLAIHFLRMFPGAHIVYDLRSSWAVRDWVQKLGGVGHEERVGHTYMKPTMRTHDAVFGGEMSGHYYFAQNAYMDNGFIPALIILEMLSKENKTLSQLVADLGEYYVSGEVNFDVQDIPSALLRIEKKYGGLCRIEKKDGVSVIAEDWHVNIRPSANDPVLRLNVEAKSKAMLEEKFEEVKRVIVVS